MNSQQLNDTSMTYYGQVLQDRFVANVLQFKRNGFFLEIGSNNPIEINNTYSLEAQLGWKGILVEYESRWLNLYKAYRPNSIPIIDDAQMIDYQQALNDADAPSDIDYLQIDLDENEGSTLNTLLRLERDVFTSRRFATVTFEHDFWASTGKWDTRAQSRDIFRRSGYVPVFYDIQDNAHGDQRAYEDWYVHPALVDMNYVHEIQRINDKLYAPHALTGRSIEGVKIMYLDRPA